MLLPGNAPTMALKGRASGGDLFRNLKKKVLTTMLNVRLLFGRGFLLICAIALCLFFFLLIDKITTYVAKEATSLKEVQSIRYKREQIGKELRRTVERQDQYFIEVAEFQQKLEDTQEQLKKQRELFLQEIETLNDQQKMLERLIERQSQSQESLESVNKQLREKITTLEAEETRIKSLQGQSHYSVQTVVGQQPAVEATPLPPAVPVNYSVPYEERRAAVKQAIKFAWDSYKKYAWGQDELRPVSKTPQNWVGMGLTIVDSIDTLWIAGLMDEFKEARDWIAGNLYFDKYNKPASVFETTIRVLGGLLSAYELSKDQMFLDKSIQLAERLLLSFGTTNNKYPSGGLNFATGQMEQTPWAGGAYILSEIGTLQLEFLYLAVKANRPDLCAKVLDVYNHLDQMPKAQHLYYLYVRPDGQWGSQHSSLGALGDSFYEYLLKMWLLTGKKVPGYRRMYDYALVGVKNSMIKKSNSGMTYIAELRNGAAFPKMDHLACFAGGMFALGAKDDEEFTVGAHITHTCHEIYKKQPSGVAPEHVMFQDPNTDFQIPQGATHYLLRPETMESYFVLWRSTHDQRYRDWGWEAFLAMERVCKTENGYSGIRDVRMGTSVYYDDMQQTFFIAETLKYLYLLFSDDDVIPLDKYVFNTEAHPLGVLDINFPEEITKYFPPEVYEPPDLDLITKQQQLVQLQTQQSQLENQLEGLNNQITNSEAKLKVHREQIMTLREMLNQTSSNETSTGDKTTIEEELNRLYQESQNLQTQQQNVETTKGNVKLQLQSVQSQLSTLQQALNQLLGAKANAVSPSPAVQVIQKVEIKSVEPKPDLLKEQQDTLARITSLQSNPESAVDNANEIKELRDRLQSITRQIQAEQETAK